MNSFYALTIDKCNDFKQFYIDLKLEVVYPSEYNSDINMTLNVTNSWNGLGLIDTGASISGVTKRVIDRLKLKPYDEKKFYFAKGNMVTPIYLFDITFPKGKVFTNIEAIEIDFHDSDFIIGMNILSQGDMAISSVDDKMLFSFRCPSANRYIDFEKI